MTMPEYMTIYCQLADFSPIVSLISSQVGWRVLTQTATTVAAATPSGSLTVNALFPGVGSKFGRIFMGTLAQVKRIPLTNADGRNALLDAIKATYMILGCVIDPPFRQSDERFTFVFAIARQNNGVVFDGFTFLNAAGEIITDLEGKTTF
jgi:hypothetical protein